MARRLLLFLLLVSLVGCGGSGGTGTPPASAVTADAVALKGLESAMQPFMSEQGAARVSRAAAIMRATPGFADVTDDGAGTATATLPSGAVFMVVDNRRESTANPAVFPARTRAGVEGEVPQSGLAVVINGFSNDPRHVSKSQEVADSLLAAGYKLVGNKVLKGTVEDYLTLYPAGGLAFFYVDSHGSKRPRPATSIVDYALATTTPVDFDNVPAIYENLVARKELAYSMHFLPDKNGNEKMGYHFNILSPFLETRVRMAKHSMAWANTCHSQAGMEAFRNAGAGLYLGWTDPVSDEGANAAVLGFLQFAASLGDPALDWEKTKAKMQASNLLWDVSYGTEEAAAKLILTPGALASAYFLPSIQGAKFGTDGKTLELEGAFGSTPGEVLDVTGEAAPLDVVTWSPTKVAVTYKPGVRKLRAKVRTVRGNDFSLGVWTLEGPNGGPFTVASSFEILLSEFLGGPAQTIFNGLTLGAGQYGPISFIEPAAKMDSRALQTRFLGTSGNGKMGPLWIVSPSGKRSQVYTGTEFWNSFYHLVSIEGFR